jgi:predicted kinase
VLVGGRPASGKTTLAQRLAGALGLAFISRDAITEALADTLGRPSRELVAPSFAVFWRLIDLQILAGVGVVAETNFHRGVAEPAVQALAEPGPCHCVLVYARWSSTRPLATRQVSKRSWLSSETRDGRAR